MMSRHTRRPGRYPAPALRRALACLPLCLTLMLGSSCGFNSVVEADEDVKAAWGNVQSAYKRRADLVPGLVATVKGAANFEKDTLTQVTEARAKVGQMRIDSSTIDSPERLRQFEAAQRQLSGALSRLMVVSEKYPELQATASFRELQAQLEGTENRINTERVRYIASVAAYNKVVQIFPTMLGAKLRGRAVRPNFEGTQAFETPPEIKF